MRRRYFFLAGAFVSQLLACRPTHKAPATPIDNPPQSPGKLEAHAKPVQSAVSQGPEAEQTPLPPTLHLSWLPEDTMAVAQLRRGSTLAEQLSHAVQTPPASRLRSLPLSVKFALQQLTLATLWPRPQSPLAALVWDSKQRAFWLWNQDDLSLGARRALEQELKASTRFEPPYWIFESTHNHLEYFVHHRAGWLLACPKDWAAELRSWLAKLSPQSVGSLSWAPSAEESAALLLRWRAPQLLESAPDPSPKALPVIGELRANPLGGIEVNGAPRSQP